MRNSFWPPLAALAVGFCLAACDGAAAEHAASEPAPGGEKQASAGDATRMESEATNEPVLRPSGGPAQVKAQLMAAEKSAFERAEPVFKQHCAKCHVKGAKKAKPKTLKHFDMTTYPFGGHHADEISAKIRKVLAIGGGKPTMPKGDPGGVQADELSLIAAWTDAYDKAHPVGSQADPGRGSVHDHESGHKH